MGEHINADGEFQSDKYPTCPPGKVPLSTKDPMAQDLLWAYAQRRRAVDAEFADDLERALKDKGYEPPYARALLGPACPGCGEPLTKVMWPSGSLLNADQFDAMRAGDWYCESCPEDIGTAHKCKNGRPYFWDKDVRKEATTASSATLARLGWRMGACPCAYDHVAPCKPTCSCRNPFMSGGCARCCSYGSEEQRRAKAARLASGPSWRKPEPSDIGALVFASKEDYDIAQRGSIGSGRDDAMARGTFVRIDDTLCFEKRDEDTEWWIRPSLHDLLDQEKIVLRQGVAFDNSALDKLAELSRLVEHPAAVGDAPERVRAAWLQKMRDAVAVINYHAVASKFEGGARTKGDGVMGLKNQDDGSRVDPSCVMVLKNQADFDAVRLMVECDQDTGMAAARAWEKRQKAGLEALGRAAWPPQVRWCAPWLCTLHATHADDEDCVACDAAEDAHMMALREVQRRAEDKVERLECVVEDMLAEHERRVRAVVDG